MAEVDSPSTTPYAVALRSFVPAAALVLLLGALLGKASRPAGATLALMGMALSFLAGLASGGVLSRFLREKADAHLIFLLCLMAMPLAVLPAQHQFVGPSSFGFHSWSSVLLGVLASLPLGFFMGISWRMWPVRAEHSLRWILVGGGLGGLVALSAVLILSLFKGAFLVMVFAAPMLWPALPREGERVLLTQMLLTMMVVVATMFLLFA